jgi:hypothetical protein
MKLQALLFLSAILLSDLEKFAITNYNEGFKNWKLREFKGTAQYKLVASPKPCITLISSQTSFSFSKELFIDLSKYPYLNFEWNVELLPEKGDLRFKELDDQAAQIYVILPFFPELVNYKAIGYVWDTNALPGVYQSKKFKNIKYVVIRSGTQGLNQWHIEKRNIYEDFKKIWGITPKKQKVVVTISIDSDDTKSFAKASFGDIYFSNE